MLPSAFVGVAVWPPEAVGPMAVSLCERVELGPAQLFSVSRGRLKQFSNRAGEECPTI